MEAVTPGGARSSLMTSEIGKGAPAVPASLKFRTTRKTLYSKSENGVFIVIRFALIEPVNSTVGLPEVSYACNENEPV